MFLILAGCTADEQGYENPSPAARIDVDLTVLSSTMLSAAYDNIALNPGSYIGQTIKAAGSYSAFFWNETDRYYHYVSVKDGAGCCQGWFEFVWSGNRVYPDDYPEDGTKIEMTGVFGSYEELGRVFYYLAVDDITVMQ
jgi:hypothetical protein